MIAEKKKKLISFVGLLLVLLIIRLFASFPVTVESIYSERIYKVLQYTERGLFGWIPMSFGDVLYTIVILFLVFKIFHLFKYLFSHKWKLIVNGLLKMVKIVLIVYIFFMTNWGLNYSRKGIGYQLDLDNKTYTTSELMDVSSILKNKINLIRPQLPDSIIRTSNSLLFQEAYSSYKYVAKKYPFLNYKIKSVKASIYSELGNYMGYTGYLNPFTGEAQVNTHTPAFELPYITCHEMAHQLGYATEDEANFVGYLAASNSQNKLFQYSVYADLFRYSINELYLRDSSLAKIQYKDLDTLVKKDFMNSRKFYLPYRNKMEHYISILYGAYLKANNQPQGIDTYSEVLSLLIAYKNKYGNL